MTFTQRVKSLFRRQKSAREVLRRCEKELSREFRVGGYSGYYVKLTLSDEAMEVYSYSNGSSCIVKLDHKRMREMYQFLGGLFEEKKS